MIVFRRLLVAKNKNPPFPRTKAGQWRAVAVIRLRLTRDLGFQRECPTVRLCRNFAGASLPRGLYGVLLLPQLLNCRNTC